MDTRDNFGPARLKLKLIDYEFDMKIYFSHGKESGPWRTKIKHLADMAEEEGCAVESVDYIAGLERSEPPHY